MTIDESRLMEVVYVATKKKREKAAFQNPTTIGLARALVLQGYLRIYIDSYFNGYPYIECSLTKLGEDFCILEQI